MCVCVREIERGIEKKGDSREVREKKYIFYFKIRLRIPGLCVLVICMYSFICILLVNVSQKYIYRTELYFKMAFDFALIIHTDGRGDGIGEGVFEIA